MAALPPVFRPAPSTATPRKSKLNTAAGSQMLVTRDQDGALGVEADTEAGDQTLANPTPAEKKRRATPKQKMARSAKQAAANNNGDNAISFDVIDEII